MRKFFLAVAALAMLATSCTKDEIAPMGNESLVSFSIDSPELATRADGDGEHITHLQYAFYNEDGILAEISKIGDDAIEFTGKTTIQVYLVEGRTYSAIFWADNEAAPYTVTFDEDNVSESTMTISSTTWTANSDIYDAFYKFEDDIRPEEKTHTITLTRPFAQINIATADTEKAEKAGVVVEASKMVAFQAYTTLNLVDGVASNKTEFTYSWAAIPTTPAKVTVNGQSFDMLAMNYVLANGRELMEKVTLGVSEEEVSATATYADAITREYTTVPVKRNYRTYIVGNLLTTPNDFEVETKPGFEDDDEEYGVIDGKVYHEVDSASEFVAALNDTDVDMVILTGDINLNGLTMRSTEDKDPTIAIAKGREFTIDLGGHKLTATSTQTGKNYNMFDVYGTLTVKNGTLECKHEGENMLWNSSTNVFNVTAGGVLNLDGVTAKNLGGSDMGFVAHLNNWGEVTLNVNNSTLESNYVAVRVFNSGNDMNNVTIKNSTLKGGSYAFWVHNYTVVDFGSEAKADAHKALLNFDVFNGTNTFVGKNNTPIRYGMTNALYSGVVTTEAELKEILDAGWCVILGSDIELAESLKTKNTTAAGAVIYLNGKTLSSVDNATGSYGLITNNGNLTVAGPGKLQLSATIDRDWNAYSSVISNNPGGNLVVEGGVVIEHLGGTDMAYGIDNLTNGKGTSAVTTVKDATVKSTYRAIRQFLNGIEATNELYVKAGAVVEGANKSIWMQDPSKNANTGSLVVAAAAQLKGNVYLTVTAGSKEWPVEVSVASAALVGESTVLTSNVPVQYEVVEVDGTWVVNEIEGAVVSTAAELTAALEAEEEVILLNAGVYEGTFNVKYNASIIGKDATIKGRVNISGDATFKNINFEINDASKATYAFSGANYKYPAIATIYAAAATFEDCDFDVDIATGVCGINYGGHVAGKPLTVNKCTFEGDFYAIRSRTLFSITNCDFNIYTDQGKLAAVFTWGNGQLGTNDDSGANSVVFTGNTNSNANEVYGVQLTSTTFNYAHINYNVQGNTGFAALADGVNPACNFANKTFAEGSETF